MAAIPAAAQEVTPPAASAATSGASEATFLAANRAKPGVVQTASGLQYQVTTPGDGASPADTDVVLINYVGRLTNGTVFDQSPQPTPMPVAGVVPGFAEALKLMQKGGKYRLWIPSALAYGSKGSGPIPPNATLEFDVDLIDFLPRATIDKYQRDLEAQASANAAAGTAFLTRNRSAPGVKETPSGLQYRVLVPVTGTHPTDADVALVNYEGKLLDGTTFDKSTQPVPMAVASVVPGFSEALKLMAKGEKIRVWIPSNLAYGAEVQTDGDGKVAIPANSTLQFDIELVGTRQQP
ncbi:MAG TPA: FKBP-type peptidyl-prolyl cis-trans isomerase [Sphingomonas sp.]